MYEPVSIQQLSPNQINKLMKGGAVRIKHSPNSNMILELAPHQIKKLRTAHKRGGGITVQFDPYQTEGHRNQTMGRGIFGDKFDKFYHKIVPKKIRDVIEPALKKVAKQGLQAGAQFISPYVSPLVAQRMQNMGEQYLDRPKDFQRGGFQNIARNLYDASSMPASGGRVRTVRRIAPRTRRGRGRGGALFPAGAF